MTAAESLPGSPWLLRPYERALDEDGMMSFLSGSYCRSSAGKREGASGFNEGNAEGQDRRRKFQGDMRPVWDWLLEHAEVTLAVDVEHPDTSIFAWLITSGPTVIHAVGCKRSVIEFGLCRDVVMDLLGPRWSSDQTVTLELPQMRSNRLGWTPNKDFMGFDRPSKWHLDPSWIARRMVPR